jgi:FlaA1/EpsC-like NDP-sugar epimerase
MLWGGNKRKIMDNFRVILDRFRKQVMVVIDVLAVNLSIYTAFLIRFDWDLSPVLIRSCLVFMLFASIIRIGLFVFFGFYHWSFRHASMTEALSVAKAVTIGSLFLIAIAFFMQDAEMGRSVLFIDYLICLFLIIISRFAPRALVKFKRSKAEALKRALIIGAGSAGETVVRELINTDVRIYKLIGFIDDNPGKINSCIHGVRVLGTTDNAKDIIERYGIDEIIIAIPSASGKAIREIISKCEDPKVKIKIVPGLHKILAEEVIIKQIRDVEPEDLLGRGTVQIDTDEINAFTRDKTILVTGAAGTIGSEICRQIVKFSPKILILLDHNENDTCFLEMELKEKYPYLKFKAIIGDIKDIGLLKYVFSKYRPNIVFHSAAFKHVPLMEENPVAAVKNNIIGTRNFMYAAEHYNVESFVMISSDKAVNPTNIMGASKRIAEMMIQAKAKRARTKFMAVRFGNVIGSSGSVVPIFKRQIEKGGPVTVTHPNVKRFFMTASEAAQLVVQAGAIGVGGEIFILDMGEQIKIYDLAKNLIALSGLEIGYDIDIKFVGLRRGEKMYEEVLHDAENDKATKHDKIYVAQPGVFDSAKLQKDVKKLERMAVLMEEDKIIEKIKKMVPTYSRNGDKR